MRVAAGLVPIQPWPTSGMNSVSTGTPALRSRSAISSDCFGDAVWSGVPWMTSIGGAEAVMCVTGLASAASWKCLVSGQFLGLGKTPTFNADLSFNKIRFSRSLSV